MLTAHAFAPTNRSVKKQLLAAYFALSLVALKLGRALMLILTVLSISMSSAFAEVIYTRLTDLLKQGYVVQAAFSSSTTFYLVLQKGTSVYQCSNVSYANAYKCIEVDDGGFGTTYYK